MHAKNMLFIGLQSRFNPLDRGNSNQIRAMRAGEMEGDQYRCFNPLDRGNSNQIFYEGRILAKVSILPFQSPRSGKF